MHFLLQNYTGKSKFSCSKLNNRIKLDATENKVKYIAKEHNSPVNYFVGNINNGVLNTSTLEDAKMFIIESVFERKKNEEVEVNKIEYKDLINEFGDKRAKENLKLREITKNVYAQKIKYNIENQLLPKVDVEEEEATNMYKLDFMFEKEHINQCNDLANILEEEEIYKGIAEKLKLGGKKKEIDFTKKMILLFADFLNGALSLKLVRKELLNSKYINLYPIIEKDIINKRINKMARDKLITKLYILLLMYNDFKFKLEDFPRFELSRSKAINLLKVIGCSITKAEVVLNKKPEIFTNKLG
ncbi:hypothetical protein NUSPORA_01619 [Nucleospora cyclopteri]